MELNYLFDDRGRRRLLTDCIGLQTHAPTTVYRAHLFRQFITRYGL